MLEGREAVHADDEPHYDLQHDHAPTPGLAVIGPPTDGAFDGADTGAGETNYPPGVHVYVADATGRRVPQRVEGFAKVWGKASHWASGGARLSYINKLGCVFLKIYKIIQTNVVKNAVKCLGAFLAN